MFMTHSSSHDFDPITQRNIEEFEARLEYDKPIETLKFEIAARAVGDILDVHLKVDAAKAGIASPEDVEYLSKILKSPSPSEDEDWARRYLTDPTV